MLSIDSLIEMMDEGVPFPLEMALCLFIYVSSTDDNKGNR